MGKNSQGRQSHNVGFTNEKTNQSFKWGRVLNVLDYHRWHYVKKVLAHKKHHDERHSQEKDSNSLDCGDGQYLKLENTENSQLEPQKTIQANSANNPLASTSSSKSSRATKLRKMIAKEISKRKSRHKRSSSNSDLEKATHIDDQHVETKNKEVVNEIIKDANNQNYNSYDPCSTMKLEYEKHNDQESNEINSLEQIPKVTIQELPFKGKIKRSASCHSIEEYPVTNEQRLNEGFNSREYSINGLTKRRISSDTRGFLTKSCTFSVSDGSRTKNLSFVGLSNTKDEIETCGNDNGEIKRRRFRDLRHKIKSLVKENRKERRRIAMDALLHKVPFGHKVSKETTKECSSVDIIEKDPYVSSKKNKVHRRSPSLDESMDKYCQLFERTNSLSKEPKSSNQENSNSNSDSNSTLRVSDVSKKKGLGRIFSSPDLQVFLSNKFEDYAGHNNISSRTPNKRIMSFREKKSDDASNIYVESGNQLPIINENENENEELKESFDVGNREEILTKDYDDEIDIVVSQGDMKNEPSDSLNVDFDDINIVTAPQPTLTIVGTNLQEDISNDAEAILSRDYEPAQSQDLSIESPSSTSTKLNEKGVHNSIIYASPSLHHIQVPNQEKEEFNYVKDILQLSGYLGTQYLGSWYSSDQPIDPSIFVKIESTYLLESKGSPLFKQGNHNYRLLLYDIVNEALLAIYERSMCYWSKPLCSCSRTHPMPKGVHVLIEVWNYVDWYISYTRNHEVEPSLDYISTCDLDKGDGWMNLQFDGECVALEVEDLIFDDLLLEIVS